MTSGGPTHVAMSPTRAAGRPPIRTVMPPGGRMGPPTWGTTPVTIGQTCMSVIRDAGIPIIPTIPFSSALRPQINLVGNLDSLRDEDAVFLGGLFGLTGDSGHDYGAGHGLGRHKFAGRRDWGFGRGQAAAAKESSEARASGRRPELRSLGGLHGAAAVLFIRLRDPFFGRREGSLNYRRRIRPRGAPRAKPGPPYGLALRQGMRQKPDGVGEFSALDQHRHVAFRRHFRLQ